MKNLITLLLILALASCMDEPPKQFSKNDPIPLGANTVKVSRIEHHRERARSVCAEFT
jgi:hypothetical protein